MLSTAYAYTCRPLSRGGSKPSGHMCKFMCTLKVSGPLVVTSLRKDNYTTNDAWRVCVC